MEREDLVARAERMGALLRDRLEPLANHPNVAEVRGMGLMLGLEFVKDRATMERFPAEARFAARVQGAGLRHGVFFYAAGSGPERDAVLEPEWVSERQREAEIDVGRRPRHRLGVAGPTRSE